uniref:Uncharacterized protein n=1 Tax=Cannabis sativa TaxID=3483 RepID=A0A803PD17_CANSA
MFLPNVTVAFELGDHEFEIMSPKHRKSRTPEDPNVVFEAELIESKVSSIGTYIGGILRSCGIKQQKGCIIRILASLKVLYYILGWECPTLLEIAWFYSVKVIPARKNASWGFYYLGAYTSDQVPRGPILTPEIVERHQTLLSLAYGLRSAKFLLNEQNLKNVGLLASDKYTCDYKAPKYTSWQKVPVLEGEENDDYVAHAHYLERVHPRLDGRPRDMDVDLENLFKSLPPADKIPRKRRQLVIEADETFEAVNEVPAARNEVPAEGIEVLAVWNVEEQPTRSMHQVKFFSSRPEVVLLEPSYPLPLEASFLVHATHHQPSQWIEMLETELRKKIKELEESLKSLRADLAKRQAAHDQKLKELEVETKERVDNIGRSTIYQIWSFNPELNFNFLGDKAEDMLGACEKTQKEELSEEEEIEVEQEGPTKSSILM